MAEGKVMHRILPSDPIVIEEQPEGPAPFLTRFATKPEIRLPGINNMDNPTYLGSTPTPGDTAGDYANDDR
jgi:hypothetical protein